MRKIITAITTAVVINKMVNCMTKNEPGVELNIGEALQKPLFPSRIEQNRSVRFFFTTSKNGVFLPSKWYNSIVLTFAIL